jgi:hypothetical protein
VAVCDAARPGVSAPTALPAKDSADSQQLVSATALVSSYTISRRAGH